MQVGTVEGAVNTERFKFEAHDDIEKFDFVTVKANTDEAEWLLAQVDEVEKKPITDAAEDAYKTVAHANIIGYRVNDLLKRPRSVIKPDSLVYQADQDVISETLGLEQDGLYMGLLETNPDIDIFLDPEDLYKHIAILAQTGAGKCVRGETPVLMANGELREMKDIFEGEAVHKVISNEDEELVELEGVNVQGMTPDGAIDTTEALFAYRKKADTLIRIKTASGREIEVSKEHPLLKAAECSFEEAQNLEEGDRIAVPRITDSKPDSSINISGSLQQTSDALVQGRLRSQESHQRVMEMVEQGEAPSTIADVTGTNISRVENWLYNGYSPAETVQGGLAVSSTGKQIAVPQDTEALSEFLALLIAEGSEPDYHYYRAIFTNTNEFLRQRFEQLADQLFGLEPKYNEDDLYLDSNALEAFLNDIGYKTRRSSREKEIPPILMRSSIEAKRRFLQTYFDCEGWMDAHEVCVVSASRDIVNKLSYMLLEFGITARIREKTKEATNSDHEGDIYYQIVVSGISDLKRFSQTIGFNIERKQQKLSNYLEGRDENTNVDTVPIDGDILRDRRTEAGLSQTELAERIDMSPMIISRYENENRNPSITTLQKIAEELDVERFRKKACSDIFWDEIEELERKENPDRYVYDISVPEDHTFVAGFGGIINHNSYSTAVIIEELLEQNYPVLIIDPHGEYHSLDTPNQIDEEDKREYGVVPEDYPTHEYSPNTDLNQHATKLTFSSKNMDANEIQQVVPTNLTNSQLGVLYTALKELKKRDSYSLDDVIETCMDQDSKAKWNLINMLEAVNDTGMFSDDPTPIEELVEPGQATIVNLKGVDPENQEATVYQLAKQLFELRKRGRLEPFFMIIEEAHNFVPEKGMGKAVSSDIMRKIASEGRKFGLGLGVISQRPANVAKNILSQCNTQIIMRVTNPNDLKAISRSFEGVTKEVEGSITSLPPGTGLILGKEYPIMTDIRVRRSQHGGETKDVSDEEGLEKREETKSLAEQAAQEEPDLSVDDQDEEPEPAHEPDGPEDEIAEESEAQDRGKEPVPDDDRVPKIETIEPVINPEETGLSDPTAAYYPLWIVTTDRGEIAIDATDGAVKDRKLNLTDEAQTILDELEKGSKTFEALDANLAIDTERLELVLEQLRDVGLIELDNGSYFYSSLDLFERDHVMQPANDAMILDEDMTEDGIIDIAKEEIGGDINNVEKIYYPYYTDNDRVFDAVQGTEV